MSYKLKVQYWPIDDVKPYPNNPRNNDDAVEYVANSIREFGWQQPIVVDTDGTIIAGHTRHKAAKLLGMDTVPVVVADNLTPAQVNAYRLADNKVAEAATWDMEALSVELEGLEIDFDMTMFDFDVKELQIDASGDWFESRERNDTSREDGNDEYNEFLDKFEAKKTTDDCYTPDLVYDAVADWVANEYGLDRENFVRPFYPNGDYQRERYKEGDVVVDNPPFSILAEILRFYMARDIKFFLFSPTLTLFSPRVEKCCFIPVGVGITYENGANVNTSFTTNLETARVHVRPTLYKAVKEANDKNLKETRKELPKYDFPSHVATAAGLSRYAVHGVEFVLEDCECVQISALDSMKEVDRSIFGSGFLLSDDAAERNEAADAQKEENKRQAEIERMENAIHGGTAEIGSGGTVVWSISDREREIISSLGMAKTAETAEAEE